SVECDLSVFVETGQVGAGADETLYQRIVSDRDAWFGTFASISEGVWQDSGVTEGEGARLSMGIHDY
ncbi:hypothetical protein KIPB_017339, partial [Kipferlia bialata]